VALRCGNYHSEVGSPSTRWVLLCVLQILVGKHWTGSWSRGRWATKWWWRVRVAITHLQHSTGRIHYTQHKYTLLIPMFLTAISTLKNSNEWTKNYMHEFILHHSIVFSLTCKQRYFIIINNLTKSSYTQFTVFIVYNIYDDMFRSFTWSSSGHVIKFWIFSTMLFSVTYSY
jgi:hypothetical protein